MYRKISKYEDKWVMANNADIIRLLLTEPSDLGGCINALLSNTVPV